MTTISLDITPALDSLRTSSAAALSSVPPVAPDSGAVSAFQTAMGEGAQQGSVSRNVAEAPAADIPVAAMNPQEAFKAVIAPLAAETAALQQKLEAAVAAPLRMPVPVRHVRSVETVPVPDVPMPSVRDAFQRFIQPLVAETLTLQKTLEMIQDEPLALKVADGAGQVQTRGSASLPEGPVLAENGDVARGTLPRDRVAPVSPQEAFKTVIAPLVAETAALQQKLEAAVAAPLVLPQTPMAETSAVIANPQEAFKAVIAPLAAETAALQQKLEAAVAAPLVLPQTGVTLREPQSVAGTLQFPRKDSGKTPVPDAEVLVAAGVQPAVPQVAAVPVEAPVEHVGSVADIRERVATLPASEVLVAAAEAVADTLLVTPGLLHGEGEVRIQLKPDVLDGTEIQLHVEGRQLSVEFVPQTADMGALIERCLPQLEAHLAAKVHSFAIATKVSKRDKGFKV